MKSLLIISSIVLLLNSSIYPQSGWYQQNSGTIQNLKFYDYYSPLSAIGSMGTFLTTSNGGYNWIIQNLSVNQNLNFRFEDFIVGDNGLILKLSGNTWVVIPSGTNQNLKSLYHQHEFFIGFAVGNNGTLLRSTNEGNNWSQVNINTTRNLNSVIYNFVVGQAGTIFKTTDQGNTWFQLNSGVTIDLNHIVNVENDTFMICGNNGRILFSSNYGISWLNRSPGNSENLNFICVDDDYVYNQKKIWVAGNNGVIKFTTNYGINWINSLSHTTQNIRCINGYRTSLYAVGDNGLILNYDLGSGYFDSTFVDANDCKPFILNNGLMHQRFLNNGDGFIWPKNTNKTAVYSSGLLIGAKINDSIRVVSNYFDYECYPGYVDYFTQIPHGKNDPLNRIYKVSPAFPGGSPIFDPWSIWPVSQGAPWLDLNHNGIYEPFIDRPLMKGDQNTFCRFTDGYPESHNELSGSTEPLNADILLYTYSVTNQQCADIHFMEYKIVNKKNFRWDSTYIGFFSDIDLGYFSDDKIGCDTALNIGFCYNATNYDMVYGSQPPAFGFVVYEASGHSGKFMDIFNHPVKNSNEPTNKNQTFNLLKGLKKDGSAWISPVNNQPTKYVLSGDPELATGWIDNTGGDKRVILSSGFNSVNPLDTIKFYVASIIKRGANHLNAVTQLKNCVLQGVIGLTDPLVSIPRLFKLYQNYPNPFNPVTTIKYGVPAKTNVSIIIYDLLGRTVKNLTDNKVTEPGIYEIDFDGRDFASGVYFYKLLSEKYTDVKKMVLLK